MLVEADEKNILAPEERNPICRTYGAVSPGNSMSTNILLLPEQNLHIGQIKKGNYAP